MNNDKCFECGNDAQEQHHVIARSLGGKKTIPLCSPCHGKAHHMKRRLTSSDLIKKGIVKAKENGIHCGLKKGTTLSDDDLLKKYPDIVNTLKDGSSVRKTVNLTKWSLGTVSKISKIINE